MRFFTLHSSLFTLHFSLFTLLVPSVLLAASPGEGGTSASSAPAWLRPLVAVKNFIDSSTVRGLDPHYITAPEKPWQIILRDNMNQGSMTMRTSGEMFGVPYSARPHMRTEMAQYVGLWAGYRGYGFGYSVNVAGDRGSYLTFGVLGGAYGVNVRIHNFKNSNPEFELSGELGAAYDSEGSNRAQLMTPIHVRTVIADAYYMFNGKRFSYAAAYDQSVYQIRSAGSLMVGAMYYYGHIDYAADDNADLIYMMKGLGRVKLWQASVGVGYAYNWVPVRGLLVNAVAMPMLTFVNRIKAYGYSTNIDDLEKEPEFWDDTLSDDEWDRWFYSHTHVEPQGSKSFNSGLTVNFDARLSLTYNIGSTWFLNAYGQFNTFRYSHDDSRGHLEEWFLNASVGIRL